MRAFVVLCLIVGAASQYHYGPAFGTNQDSNGYTGNQELSQSSVQTQDQNGYPKQEATLSEFNKEFYSYTAPEQDFEDSQVNQKIASILKRNLQVVFVKGPDNQGLENALIQLAKKAAEQQTAIYVLNKQTDIRELTEKLNDLNKNVNRKPEVHFIKYRTQEDAANAQKLIQGQYDTLPGPSNNGDASVAPVLDFSSKKTYDNVANNANANGLIPRATYLPSSRRH